MEQAQITREQAEVAAQWWAEQVVNPSFDNGDPSMAGCMAMMLAMMTTKPVEDNKQEEFKQALVEIILETNPRWLDVDYHPCRELAQAAELAGVSEMNFPWKTNMQLRDGKVIVAKGYGKPFQQIWPIEDEQGDA